MKIPVMDFLGVMLSEGEYKNLKFNQNNLPFKGKLKCGMKM